LLLANCAVKYFHVLIDHCDISAVEDDFNNNFKKVTGITRLFFKKKCRLKLCI